MTLREIIRAHPGLFYGQTWYEGEAFMDREPSGELEADFLIMGFQVTPYPRPVTAADLAALYVTCPDDHRWRRFLWTDDRDHDGQRIYVAGVGQFGCEGFQIHRHLRIDQRWGWVA